jgi:hypothetical protein
MKLQKWALFRGSMEPATNGHWVQASDAEAIIDKLKCCGNCKHGRDGDEENCQGCLEPKLQKWEMRRWEADNET